MKFIFAVTNIFLLAFAVDASSVRGDDLRKDLAELKDLLDDVKGGLDSKEAYDYDLEEDNGNNYKVTGTDYKESIGKSAANNKVKVFQHCGFKGYGAEILPGKYNLDQLVSMGIKNDDLSSISIPRGYEVKIFEHAGFTGFSRTLHYSVSCLVDIGLNDHISSIIIQPTTVKVFKHCAYQGHAVELPPGKYNLDKLVSMGITNDDLSSINIPLGLEVKVYQHADFTGYSRTLTSSISCLTAVGLNDEISAIIVERL